ncbi:MULTISPECIES: hypothetical protein [Candidatus Ichthyocystis]|uniref:Uncharacterized protein n=1 Tax=Candidatus Ichthyocystis hellenicum TaxID=1561003 RepID=A0A0S4M272_9BURK|nr:MULTISPECIES: hypothetical protein [Ichthyocystis]CUT17865.1 hypothetical protein Ark11_1049 [Candidatus Ichthyocystis hellenicum]
MYTCHLGDFAVSKVSEKENIDNASELENYLDSCEINSQDLDFHENILQKDKLPFDQSNIDDVNNSYQSDNYKEKELLVLDSFNLSELDGSNLETTSIKPNTDQRHRYRAIKRPLTEDDLESTTSSQELIDLESVGSTGDYCDVSSPEESKTSMMTKKTKLKVYRSSSLCSTEFNLSIYKDAINKIDIDSNGLFKNAVLEKAGNYFKNGNIVRSSANFSKTHSNVRRYVLGKVSPFIDNITSTGDISITPGMSISDLRFNCISNNHFFEKLHENCKKILEDINLIPCNSLSDLFQSCINFHSNSFHKKVKFCPKKDRFLPILKLLIIDTISNLPNSIICAINKFSKNEIVDSLFLDVHGVMLSKSLIKDLYHLFNYSRSKIADNELEDNLNLLNGLLERLGNIVKTHCIFDNGVFLPAESTVEQLSKYLLSDIYCIPVKLHKKLNPHSESRIIHKEPIENIYYDNTTMRDFITNTFLEKGVELTKLDLANKISRPKSDMMDTEVETIDNFNNEQDTITSSTKNDYKLNQFITLKELNIKSYHKSNLSSKELTSSIYEDAIRKIDIDSNGFFKKVVLEKLDAHISSRCFKKSSINLSLTYSNVRKYVLEKISPYINDIIPTADILITPGMSVSDMGHKCTSNTIFFYKLHEKCEEVVKSIRTISEDNFLSMVQSYIRFGSEGKLNIVHKRNIFCSEVKLLIINTISNLPNSITKEIGNFKQSRIARGLFSEVHGVFMTKSFIRKLISQKPSDNHFKINLKLLRRLFSDLVSTVKTSFILHEGQLFFPDECATIMISRYLLFDIYDIPSKIYRKLSITS